PILEPLLLGPNNEFIQQRGVGALGVLGLAAFVAEMLEEVFNERVHGSQLLPGQSLVRFEIFCRRFGDDVRRQHRAWWIFVPIESFEIVADELFVEAWLAFAG